MNNLFVGVITFTAMLFFSLRGENAAVFLNTHSFVIVFVGSFAILAIANPNGFFTSLARIGQSLFSKPDSYARVSQALITLSKNRHAAVDGASHPLIVYAKGLWEQGLEPETALLLLRERHEDLLAESQSSITLLRNWAKYPPALGMVGTVVGLINLFSNLNPESKTLIGPSLAMAMTATFYGLVFSNGILMPFADRLHVSHQERSKQNQFVFHILCLIHEGQPQLVVQEEVYAKSA